MPYVINNTSGTRIFYVGDQSFNTETVLTLPGRNVPDYGEPVDTNFIHMLENFANDTPPQSTVTLQGQLWYDTSDGIFKVYDGANWVQTGKVPVSELPPAGNQSEGNFYFDESILKLKVYYDNTWYDSSYAGEISSSYNTIGQGFPTLYGARIRNIFLRRASDNRDVPVLAIVQSYNGANNTDIVEGTVNTLYGKETLIGLFSRNDAFTALDVTTNSEEEALNFWDELNEPGGIGTVIKPGLNVRKDATAEYPIASLAQRAQTSYALNLGSYGADGANIAAANVFHHGADSLPVANLTYDLGGPANVFAELWVDDIYLSSAIIANGDNVSLGTDSNPIENIYVTNIEIDGNLIIEGDDVSIGSPVDPVDDIYVNNAYVYEKLSIGNVINETNYEFPDSRSTNSRLVCDGKGILYWLDNGALFTNISPGNNKGIEVSIRVDDYPGEPYQGIYNREATISAVLGNGLSFDANGAIQVEFTQISTCDIQEGEGCVDNIYYSDDRVYQFLSVATDPSYLTGLETVEISGQQTLRMNGGAFNVVGTVNAEDGGAITVSQNRNNTDERGFNEITIGLDLGPLGLRDGGQTAATQGGLVYRGDKLGLDWRGVAENLYVGGSGPTGSAGTIGIREINTGPGPATHEIYVASIDNLGNGGGLENIMYRNVVNTMTSSAKIKFGTITLINNGSTGTWTHNGTFQVSGAIRASGDITAFTSVSDVRLKENLEIIPEALAKVGELNGYTFNYKDRPEDRISGLIAQDLEKVLPEAVYDLEEKSQDGDNYKAVRYDTVIPLLVEAIKELTQEVNTLKAKLGE